jgi:DNA polymerase-3 subunit alpha
MDAQRSVFVEGASKNDINEKKANKIFDLIDKTFSGAG